MTLGAEKRLTERKEFHGMVRLCECGASVEKDTTEAEKDALQLTAINISRDGICLRTEYFFVPNHLFQLDFSIMDRPVHTLARVVWSEKNTCGLQFIKPGDLTGIFEEESVNTRMA
jgi:hypothetical protein